MPRTPPIIDTNITLGQWPTRRVPCDKLEALIAKFRAHNVTHAWTSHYDALFHADLTEVNNRLAEICTASNANSRPPPLAGQSAPQLIPFGSINPLSPNWRTELDRCQMTHKI